jgi:hypothetical protein
MRFRVRSNENEVIPIDEAEIFGFLHTNVVVIAVIATGFLLLRVRVTVFIYFIGNYCYYVI